MSFQRAQGSFGATDTGGWPGFTSGIPQEPCAHMEMGGTGGTGYSPGITGTASPRLGELSSVQVAWKIRLCLQELLGQSKAKNSRKLKFVVLLVWGFFFHQARARVGAGSPDPTSPWSSLRSHCSCSRTAVKWCER